MNDDILLKIYNKYNLSSKGSFDVFKSDMQNEEVARKFYDKYGLSSKGDFETFKNDIGAGRSYSYDFDTNKNIPGADKDLGFRNNNPLNLRPIGKGGFRKFNSLEEGYQAAARDLNVKVSGKSPAFNSYLSRNNKAFQNASVADLINVWAPPTENSKEALQNYYKVVGQELGIDPFNTHPSKVNTRDLAIAMSKVESPLSYQSLMSAWGGSMPKGTSTQQPAIEQPVATSRQDILNGIKQKIDSQYSDYIKKNKDVNVAMFSSFVAPKAKRSFLDEQFQKGVLKVSDFTDKELDYLYRDDKYVEDYRKQSGELKSNLQRQLKDEGGILESIGDWVGRNASSMAKAIGFGDVLDTKNGKININVNRQEGFVKSPMSQLIKENYLTPQEIMNLKIHPLALEPNNPKDPFNQSLREIQQIIAADEKAAFKADSNGVYKKLELTSKRIKSLENNIESKTYKGILKDLSKLNDKLENKTASKEDQEQYNQIVQQLQSTGDLEEYSALAKASNDANTNLTSLTDKYGTLKKLNFLEDARHVDNEKFRKELSNSAAFVKDLEGVFQTTVEKLSEIPKDLVQLGGIGIEAATGIDINAADSRLKETLFEAEKIRTSKQKRSAVDNYVKLTDGKEVVFENGEAVAVYTPDGYQINDPIQEAKILQHAQLEYEKNPGLLRENKFRWDGVLYGVEETAPDLINIFLAAGAARGLGTSFLRSAAANTGKVTGVTNALKMGMARAANSPRFLEAMSMAPVFAGQTMDEAIKSGKATSAGDIFISTTAKLAQEMLAESIFAGPIGKALTGKGITKANFDNLTSGKVQDLFSRIKTGKVTGKDVGRELLKIGKEFGKDAGFEGFEEAIVEAMNPYVNSFLNHQIDTSFDENIPQASDIFSSFAVGAGAGALMGSGNVVTAPFKIKENVASHYKDLISSITNNSLESKINGEIVKNPDAFKIHAQTLLDKKIVDEETFTRVTNAVNTAAARSKHLSEPKRFTSKIGKAADALFGITADDKTEAFNSVYRNVAFDSEMLKLSPEATSANPVISKLANAKLSQYESILEDLNVNHANGLLSAFTPTTLLLSDKKGKYTNEELAKLKKEHESISEQIASTKFSDEVKAQLLELRLRNSLQNIKKENPNLTDKQKEAIENEKTKNNAIENEVLSDESQRIQQQEELDKKQEIVNDLKINGVSSDPNSISIQEERLNQLTRELQLAENADDLLVIEQEYTTPAEREQIQKYKESKDNKRSVEDTKTDVFKRVSFDENFEQSYNDRYSVQENGNVNNQELYNKDIVGVQKAIEEAFLDAFPEGTQENESFKKYLDFFFDSNPSLRDMIDPQSLQQILVINDPNELVVKNVIAQAIRKYFDNKGAGAAPAVVPNNQPNILSDDVRKSQSNIVESVDVTGEKPTSVQHPEISADLSSFDADNIMVLGGVEYILNGGYNVEFYDEQNKIVGKAGVDKVDVKNNIFNSEYILNKYNIPGAVSYRIVPDNKKAQKTEGASETILKLQASDIVYYALDKTDSYNTREDITVNNVGIKIIAYVKNGKVVTKDTEGAIQQLLGFLPTNKGENIRNLAYEINKNSKFTGTVILGQVGISKVTSRIDHHFNKKRPVNQNEIKKENIFIIEKQFSDTRTEINDGKSSSSFIFKNGNESNFFDQLIPSYWLGSVVMKMIDPFTGKESFHKFNTKTIAEVEDLRKDLDDTLKEFESAITSGQTSMTWFNLLEQVRYRTLASTFDIETRGEAVAGKKGVGPVINYFADTKRWKIDGVTMESREDVLIELSKRRIQINPIDFTDSKYLSQLHKYLETDLAESTDSNYRTAPTLYIKNQFTVSSEVSTNPEVRDLLNNLKDNSSVGLSNIEQAPQTTTGEVKQVNSINDLPTTVQEKVKELQNNSSFIKLSTDEKSYINNNEIDPKTNKPLELQRTTGVISDEEFEDTALTQSAKTIGTKVDSVGRDVLNDEVRDFQDYDLSDNVELFNKTVAHFSEIKSQLKSRGEIIIPGRIVLYNNDLKIAGEVDVMTVDAKGVFRIYDIKTMKGQKLTPNRYGEVAYESNKVFEKTGETKKNGEPKYRIVPGKTQDSTRQKHQKQVSVYSILANTTHRVPVAPGGIIPFEVDYNPGDTKVSDIRPYSIIEVDLIPTISEATNNKIQQVASVEPLSEITSEKPQISANSNKEIKEITDQQEANNKQNDVLKNQRKVSDDTKTRGRKELLKASTKDYTAKETDDKGISWFKERLEEVGIEINDETISQLYNVFKLGGTKLWGAFHNASVILASDASSKVTKHEAFHVVFNLFLNDKQREQILDEAFQRFGKELGITKEEYELAKKQGKAADALFSLQEQPIKPGVSELFESNPELANEVYEAAGFNKIINVTDSVKDIFSNEVLNDLGNRYPSLFNNVEYITTTEDFLKKLEPEIKKIQDKYSAYSYFDKEKDDFIDVVKYDNRTAEDKLLLSFYEKVIKGTTYISGLHSGIVNAFTLNRNEKEAKVFYDRFGISKNKSIIVINNPKAEYLKAGLVHEAAHLFDNIKINITSEEVDKIISSFEGVARQKQFGTIGFKNPGEYLKLEIEKGNNKEIIPVLAQLYELQGTTPVKQFNDDILPLFQITPQQKQQAQQLYSQYLNAIFPDSKVKDIVYHGSGHQFDKFLKEKLSQSPVIHFSKKKDYTDWYKFNYPVLLNIKKLYDYGWLDRKEKEKDTDLPAIEGAVLDNFNESDLERLTKQGYDGAFGYGQITYEKGVPTDNLEYVVFEPEQIHILGGKQDIEGFKKFVSSPSVRLKTEQAAYYKAQSPLIRLEEKLADLFEDYKDGLSLFSESNKKKYPNITKFFDKIYKFLFNKYNILQSYLTDKVTIDSLFYQLENNILGRDFLGRRKKSIRELFSRNVDNVLGKNPFTKLTNEWSSQDITRFARFINKDLLNKYLQDTYGSTSVTVISDTNNISVSDIIKNFRSNIDSVVESYKLELTEDGIAFDNELIDEIVNELKTDKDFERIVLVRLLPDRGIKSTSSKSDSLNDNNLDDGDLETSQNDDESTPVEHYDAEITLENWQQNEFSVDPLTRMSAKLKEFLSNIPITNSEGYTMVSQDTGQIDYYDYEQIHNKLLSELSDSEPDTMLQKLNKLREEFDWAKIIIRNIYGRDLYISRKESGTLDLTMEDLYNRDQFEKGDILTSIWNTIADQTNRDFVFIQTTDTKTNLIKSNSANKVNELTQKATSYFNNKFKRNGELNYDYTKFDINVATASIKEIKDLLNDLGFAVDNSVITSVLKNNSLQLQALFDNIRYNLSIPFLEIDSKSDNENTKIFYKNEEGKQRKTDGNPIFGISALLYKNGLNSEKRNILTLKGKTKYNHGVSNYLNRVIASIKEDPQKFFKSRTEYEGGPILMHSSLEWYNDNLNRNIIEVVYQEGQKEKFAFKGEEYGDMFESGIESLNYNIFASTYNNKLQQAHFTSVVFSDSTVKTSLLQPVYPINSKKGSTIIDKLTNIAFVELQRINLVRTNRKANVETGFYNLDKNGDKFQFLTFLNNAGLNLDNILEEILVTDSTTGLQKLSENAEKKIREEIEKNLENNFTKYVQKLINNGSLGLGKDNNIIIPSTSNIDSNTSLELLRLYYYNQFYYNSTFQLVFGGDLAHYKEKDPNKTVITEAQKRDKQIVAPYSRGLWGKKLTFKSLFLKDIEIPTPSDIINNIIKNFNYNQTEVETIVNALSSNNITDAATVHTLARRREIMKAMHLWKPNKHEAMFERLEKGLPTPEDLREILQPLKPFYYGLLPMMDDTSNVSHFVPVQLKNAEMVLLPSVAFLHKDGSVVIPKYDKSTQEKLDFNEYQYPDLAKILYIMNRNSVDTVLFESAVKASHFKFADFSELNDSVVTQYSLELPNEYWGIQMEVPKKHEDEKVLIGSQIRKIITGDLDPNVVFKYKVDQFTLDKILKDVFNNNANDPDFIEFKSILESQELFSENTLRDLIDMTYELDIKEGLNDTEKFTSDYNKVVDHLRDKSLEKDPSKHVIDSYEIQSDNKTLVPLEISGKKNESYLNSLYKRISKIKQAGAGLVNMTSLGFVARDGDPIQDQLQIVYSYDQNGDITGIDHIEAAIPANSKIFYAFADKYGNVDVEKIRQFDPSLLDAIFYRIPTEGKYSIFPIKITKILPPNAGGKIILPKEATSIAGLDFDVDKMYGFFKKFKVSINNDLLNGISESLNDQFNVSFTNNEYSDLINLLISNDIEDDSFLDSIDPKYDVVLATLDYTLKEFENKFGKSNFYKIKSIKSSMATKESRANLRLDAMLQITKSKEFARDFHNVGSKKQLTDIVARLQQNIDPNRSFADPAVQEEIAARNIIGKRLIGIFANANAFHNLIQGRSNLFLEKPFIFNETSYSSFNNTLDKIGNKISKSIAILLFASTEDAKEPVLAALNINPYTAGMITTMLRLGVPLEEALDYIRSPFIKALVKYSNANNTDFTKITSSEKVFNEAISEIAIEESPETLEQFFELANISKDMLNIERAAKVDTGNVGPELSNIIQQLMSIQNTIFDPESRIRGAETVLPNWRIDSSTGKYELIRKSPVRQLNAYTNILIQEVNQLSKYFNYFTPEFNSLRDQVKELTGSTYLSADKVSLITTEIFNAITQKVLNSSGVDIYNLIHKFPSEFILSDILNQDKYSKLKNAFKIVTDTNGIDVLQLSSKFSKSESEEIRNQIETLILETQSNNKLGTNLAIYSMLLGHKFSSGGFYHLIPPSFYKITPEGQQIRSIVNSNSVNSNEYSKIERGYEILYNNFTRLVPRVLPKTFKVLKDGSYLLKDGKNRFVYVRTDSGPILLEKVPNSKNNIYNRVTIGLAGSKIKDYIQDKNRAKQIFEEISKTKEEESLMKYEEIAYLRNSDVTVSNNPDINKNFQDALNQNVINNRENISTQITVDGQPIGTWNKPTSTQQTAIDSSNKINIYAGTRENAELSNLAVRNFVYNNISFNSVEQAYQSLKGGKFDKATYDNKAYIPFNRNGVMTVSKFRGPLGTTTDLEQTQLMKELLKASFEQNPDALAKLLATGNAELTHTQDTEKWGKEFPRLLMEVREELRSISTQQQIPTSDITSEVIAYYEGNIGENLNDDSFIDNMDKPPYIIDRDLKNPDGTIRYGSSTNEGTIFIRPVESLDQFFDYIEGKVDSYTSKQKQIVLQRMSQKGWDIDTLKNFLNTKRLANLFILLHEQDHIVHNDRDVYWVNGRSIEDMISEDKIQIETRASLNALMQIKAAKDNNLPCDEIPTGIIL